MSLSFCLCYYGHCLSAQERSKKVWIMGRHGQTNCMSLLQGSLHKKGGATTTLGEMKPYNHTFLLTPCALSNHALAFDFNVGRQCFCVPLRARSLVPSPLKDDVSMGGLLWSHRSVQGRCAKIPAPPHCWLALFSRFPLDF